MLALALEGGPSMERYKLSTCAVPTGVRYIREYFNGGLLPQYIVSPGCGYLSVSTFVTPISPPKQVSNWGTALDA